MEQWQEKEIAQSLHRFGDTRKTKMGRQPRSGDIPWLAAHSTLNWIGGDSFMLDPLSQKSSIVLRRPESGLDKFRDCLSLVPKWGSFSYCSR